MNASKAFMSFIKCIIMPMQIFLDRNIDTCLDKIHLHLTTYTLSHKPKVFLSSYSATGQGETTAVPTDKSKYSLLN